MSNTDPDAAGIAAALPLRVGLPIWTLVAPVVGCALLAVLDRATGGPLLAVVALGLIANVLAAVHHAEVIALRIGEPYGTLVLAVAVTLIEVALIVSIMLSGGPESTALARDTVFAAVMIILNGIIGFCLLIGGWLHREQTFSLDGVGAALVALAAITTLTLVFPNYTVTVVGPSYSPSQLALIAVVSLVVYVAFVLVQTVGHRAYFLAAGEQEDADPVRPGGRVALASAVLLLVCLAVVVLLAKGLAPTIEAAVTGAGAPEALVGVIIAAVVLMPEGVAAVRAARRNRLQTSLNLALGSALASIGLTIPVVALLSFQLGLTLTLGIDTKSTVLLVLSLFVTSLALRTGRTIALHGVVLLVLFAVYLFTIVVP